MTATSERGLRHPAAIAAVVVALVVVAVAAVLSASDRGTGGAFGWLRARPAPAGWAAAGLPGGGGTLFHPAGMQPLRGDAGSLTYARLDSVGVVSYLNATPRQGAETLAGWTGFRLEHLGEENGHRPRLHAAATGLRFRGGTGSCVIDDYVTAVRSQHYQEIACLVHGRSADTVVVAAARYRDWNRYAGVLERAVSAFTAA